MTHEQEANQNWQQFTEEERETLLKGLGFDTSWKVCKDFNEMTQRGGGMIAKHIATINDADDGDTIYLPPGDYFVAREHNETRMLHSHMQHK